MRESSGRGQGRKGTEAQRQKEAKQFQGISRGAVCCKTDPLRQPRRSNGQRQLTGAMTRLRIKTPFSVQHVSACGRAVVVSAEDGIVFQGNQPCLHARQTRRERR